MRFPFLLAGCLLAFALSIGFPTDARAQDQELSEDVIPEDLFDDDLEAYETADPDTGAAEQTEAESAGDGGGIEHAAGEDVAPVEFVDSPIEEAAEAYAEPAGLDDAPVEATAQAAIDVDAEIIDQVVIGGNDRVEEESIRIKTEVLAGTALDPEAVDADIRSIYEMGFFHNVEARVEREAGRTVLTYWVSERPLIREVRFEGNDKISKEKLEVALKIHPRTILNPVRIRRGIEDAKKAYEEEGYLDAEISYRAEQVGSGETTVTFTVQEEKPTDIVSVNFEGNESFADARLQSIMQTRKKTFLSMFFSGGTLNREALKTDTDRITAFYYDNGYINVKVDEPRIERKDEGIHVTVRIDEGEQYTIGEVSIVGEYPGSENQALRAVEVEEGEVFKASSLREDVFRLTGFFSNLGYAFVNVEPETGIEQDDSVVNIAYRIDQGPEVYIDRVDIAGNTKTRDKVIRRELRIAEQSKFNASSLEFSRNRVQRLGYFSDVNIATRRGARSDLLNVLVDVKEAQTGAFSVGAGFNTATSLIGSARIQESNLFGRGQQFVISGSLGSRYRNSTVSWTDPYFLDTHLTFGAEVFDWKFAFEDFDRSGLGGGFRTYYPVNRLGLTTLWGYPLDDVFIGMNYQWEKAKISDFDAITPTPVQAEAGSQVTSKITPTLRRNTLNHPTDPTGGSFQQIRFSQAGLGGDATYSKAEFQAQFFTPVYRNPRWGQLTWMTNTFFGYGFGDIDYTCDPDTENVVSWNNRQTFGHPDQADGATVSPEVTYCDEKERVLDGDLPIFDRYFPGGLHSVRGFGERSLGPRQAIKFSADYLNEEDEKTYRRPFGGSQQLVFQNELGFPLVKALNLKGAVFNDVGNAFSAEQGLDLGDLRYSVGAGIRWKSPFGPIRIELAKALNAKSDERTSNIHFAFGGQGGAGSIGGGRGRYGGY